MVAYTYNPSTPEAEVERLPCMSLRSAWTTVGDTTSEMKQKGRRGRGTTPHTWNSNSWEIGRISSHSVRLCYSVSFKHKPNRLKSLEPGPLVTPEFLFKYVLKNL